MKHNAFCILPFIVAPYLLNLSHLSHLEENATASSSVCHFDGQDGNKPEELKDVQYTSQDSATIVGILQREPHERDNENRVVWLGKQFVGTPYVGGTLESGDKEHLIVNTRAMDCTTFVETVSALFMCCEQNQRTFPAFCRNLQKIRYKSGCIADYTSRLHYFTQWGLDNEKKGIVTSVLDSVDDIVLSCQRIHTDYMSKHPALYKHLRQHPEFISTIRRQERELEGYTFKYLPKKSLGLSPDRLPYVHTGDIVAIITSRQGLDTSHVGFAVWKSGQLHLMHASSLKKKVTLDSQTFYNYSQGQRTQQGIRLFRLMEQPHEK